MPTVDFSSEAVPVEPSGIARLARKWCPGCLLETPLKPTALCVCKNLAAAICEALEEAEKIGNVHIAKLKIFRLARNTYVPAIVREIEQVVAAIRTLREERYE